MSKIIFYHCDFFFLSVFQSFLSVTKIYKITVATKENIHVFEIFILTFFYYWTEKFKRYKYDTTFKAVACNNSVTVHFCGVGTLYPQFTINSLNFKLLHLLNYRTNILQKKCSVS